MPLPDIPPGIETKANNELAAFAETIGGMQGGYLSSHSRYFQGILSSAVPEDGQTATPDPSKKPTDQAESYADESITFPASPIIAMGVDVYDGDSGKGYIVFAEIKIAGQLWRKQTDYGPESRSYDWVEIDEVA